MKEGGSYKVDKSGKRTLVHRTQPHPDGSAPRDASGKRLDIETSTATPAAGKKAGGGNVEDKSGDHES